jgi:hypothetical protein
MARLAKALRRAFWSTDMPDIRLYAVVKKSRTVPFHLAWLRAIKREM